MPNSACRATAPYPTAGGVERLDPALGAWVPRGATPEILAGGFGWSEGRVWRKGEGYLLFTDIPRNTIYCWDREGGLSVYLRPTGVRRPRRAGGGTGQQRARLRP